MCPQEESVHLNFSSPAHRPVIQDIPLVRSSNECFNLCLQAAPLIMSSSQINTPVCLSKHNDTSQDWKMQAVVCGEGFSGPKVVNVPAGTKCCYPLTFHPSVQCVVMVTNDFLSSFVFSCISSSFVIFFLLKFACYSLCDSPRSLSFGLAST